MSATPEQPKPGLAAAILIPLFIWIAFSVVAVVFLVVGIKQAEETTDEFARIPSGQATEVDLTAAGDYRIWLDCQNGGDYGYVSASGTITGPDGQDIAANTYGSSLTYGDLEAVLTFDAPSEGTYTFEITDRGTSSCADPRFAIGKDNPAGQLFTGIALMLVLGSIGFVIALILLIVMLVRRGRSKRRIVQAGIQSGGYGAGGYGGGGYGGGYPPPGGYPPAGPPSW